MFSETNKWVAVISLLYAGATGSISYLISFSLNYGELLRDLLFLSIFSAIGQIFVYRMVKEFKQHIVPFVITTRKIFTVVISIFVYKHETSGMQVVGIAIVFISAIYEYCA
jgi:UDP-galactose transporter B1